QKGWYAQWASFLVLLVLAALGYRRLWPQRRGAAAPLFLAPLMVSAFAVVTFGDPITRAAIDPALAIVAAVALAGLAGRRRERAAEPRPGSGGRLVAAVDRLGHGAPSRRDRAKRRGRGGRSRPSCVRPRGHRGAGVLDAVPGAGAALLCGRGDDRIAPPDRHG